MSDMMKLQTKAKRKMKKKIKASITAAISAVLLIGLNLINEYIPIFDQDNKQEVTFKKCTDGDTAHFMIDGKNRTVRFLAINTPEIEHSDSKAEPYGKEASNYTCKALKEAKTIEVEFDANAKQDKYDRYLGWVFVDGELLQEKLILEGYAKVDYLYDDYKYTDQLLQAEKIAKKSKKGIWK